MTPGELASLRGAGAQILTGLDAATVLNNVLAAAKEYAEVREVETTKRAQIEARKAVALAEIEARRELFITYLERSFDEREKNFAELFRALDAAMKSDTGQVAEILGAITTLAASSPFKDLHDPVAVRNALDDPNHEWEV